MTLDEMAQLLAVAAEIDPRVVPTREKVLAWHQLVGDLDARDAAQALTAHYRGSRESVMPADLIEGVRLLAEERRVRGPVLAPSELRVCRAAGIPPEEWAERRSDREWVRAVSAAHGLTVPESGQNGPRVLGVGNDTGTGGPGSEMGAQRHGEATS
jgi:hypothetical protein